MNGRLLIAIVAAMALVGASAWLLLGQGRGDGPQIAAENPCDVFPSLDGALAEWMREQRELQSALTCEHFEKMFESTPAVTPAPLWSDTASVLQRAPERWRSPEKGRMLLPGAENLALVDLAAGTRRVLLQSDGPQRWTDAGWMDSSSFVAAGTVALAGKQAPSLTVFRLDTNRVTVFRGPSSPAR